MLFVIVVTCEGEETRGEQWRRGEEAGGGKTGLSVEAQNN